MTLGRERLEAPKTLEEVAAIVHATERKVRQMQSYDDRLGSAVKRLWYQTLVILSLLSILGMLIWDKTQVKPEILPYLYVEDREGEIIWKGVPGTYTVRDKTVLNHLEDWVKDARERPIDPTFVQIWKAWTKADGMVQKGSACDVLFQKYMAEADPRKLTRPPRVDVQILSKGTRVRNDTSGDYRLSWQELQISPSGTVLGQTVWEGDFTVALEIPKTFLQAQQTNRYDIQLSECTMKQQVGGF